MVEETVSVKARPGPPRRIHARADQPDRQHPATPGVLAPADARPAPGPGSEPGHSAPATTPGTSSTAKLSLAPGCAALCQQILTGNLPPASTRHAAGSRLAPRL